MASAPARRSRSEVPVARFVLPVSGAMVSLHQPTGADDVLLTEHRVDDPALALALAERLGRAKPALDWSQLPVCDIDTLIVRLRQALIGDRVTADVPCADAACGQRVDVSFGIDAYLMHHRPRPGRANRSTDAPGWFVLPAKPAAADAVRFRLPTLADQIAVDGLPDAVAGLTMRCVQGAGPRSGRLRGQVEAAIAALAPVLAGPLQGQCPHCATPIAAWFLARRYCLQELQDRARFIYDDVNTLAERYHWSERAILTLPHMRRTSYAERARQARLG